MNDDHTRKVRGARSSNQPRLTRDEFAKISEVEGLRLSDTMKQAFADFDRRALAPEERRRLIVDRFKRAAKYKDVE